MRTERVSRGAGGKGLNVARVLTTLGVPALATCPLGGAERPVFESLLAPAKFAFQALEIAGDVRTNVTLSAAGKSVCKVNQPGPRISAHEWHALKTELATLCAGKAWVVIAGAPAPGLPTGAYAELTRLAHAAGAQVALDCAGPALAAALAEHPDLIKPNRTELAATVGRNLPTRAALLKAMREMQSRGARRVVVTDGGRALWGLPTATDAAPGLCRVQPPRVAVQGVVGAGDACLAGLIAALLRGRPLAEALKWGAACGAATSALPDPQFPTRREIKAALARVE
jgi:1-phosphofructokinase